MKRFVRWADAELDRGGPTGFIVAVGALAVFGSIIIAALYVPVWIGAGQFFVDALVYLTMAALALLVLSLVISVIRRKL